MKPNRLAPIIALSAMFIAPMSGWGQTGTAPDNSGMNAPEKSAGAPTADQQSNNQGDVELTRQIRRSVEKDDSLSLVAHQVKIISSNGSVILRGPVKTENEKQAIGAKAQAIAGADKVNNQLEVERQ
jgi:hyperosmotically inducible periplasmic protein